MLAHMSLATLIVLVVAGITYGIILAIRDLLPHATPVVPNVNNSDSNVTLNQFTEEYLTVISNNTNDTNTEGLDRYFYNHEYLLSMAEPTDCYDLLNLGHNTSGIYNIRPQNRIMKERSIPVYCDMKTDGGGWTVIQRRGDFKRPIDYFYKDWEEYKRGFGYLDKDFWLGNDYIFAISNQKEYTARFDMKAVDGERKYAHYDFFWIDDENNNYTLHIRDYSGDAGDSMYPKHDGQMFSTKDRKNDKWNQAVGCAESFKGAWWYNACHDSNLNGLYLKGPHESHANGVNWKSWRGHKESLAETEIKIRPKVYRKIKSVPELEPHPKSETPL